MEASNSSEDFPFLARLEVLPEWEVAARRFLELGGAVLVLGAPDTGKSTLCRYLVYRAFAAGHPEPHPRRPGAAARSGERPPGPGLPPLRGAVVTSLNHRPGGHSFIEDWFKAPSDFVTPRIY